MERARAPRRIWAVVIGAAMALAACQGPGEPNGPGSSAPATASASLTSTSAQPPLTNPVTTTSSRATATPPTASTRPGPSSTTQACSIPSRLLGRDLTTLGTTRKIVALTFDGGSGNEGVASILRTLASEHVPGSFFVTGQFVDAFPASARAIAVRYPVGNHTTTTPT